jgi:sugar phosphate isomerase/epimerase
LGVTIDTGHSLAEGENMVEAAVILSDYGRKLFHLHSTTITVAGTTT